TSADVNKADIHREALAESLNKIVGFFKEHEESSLEELIKELKTETNKYLFSQLGSLTRELHDSLEGFAVDVRIDELTESELPSTIVSLDQVISATEEAVHNTLNSVELGKKALCQLQQSEGTTLTSEQQKHLETIDQSLKDILLAQSFQDLSGQTIKKVIDTTHRAQTRLIRLMCDLGGITELHSDTIKDVNSLDENRVTQDEIDDILSDLGFD
ncbi:MAG TPA: hypothetical protein DCZ03_15440, partial [Gammaproteobacteria bacterium]|nr:hypothetical protein [Gammaproteobacteria bacterium]